ncbi:rootletin, partial [Bacteroidales bacterium KHT7]
PTLDLPWTYLGPTLDLPWTYLGPTLDLPWTYEQFLTKLFVTNPKLSINSEF